MQKTLCRSIFFVNIFKRANGELKFEKISRNSSRICFNFNCVLNNKNDNNALLISLYEYVVYQVIVTDTIK